MPPTQYLNTAAMLTATRINETGARSINAVRALSHQFAQDGKEKESRVLDTMLDIAVGHLSAVSLKELAIKCGVTRRFIQLKVIKPSRTCRAFIGMCQEGVFIHACPEDIAVTAAWYSRRIAAESMHLSYLTGLLSLSNG